MFNILDNAISKRDANLCVNYFRLETIGENHVVF